MDTDSFIIPIKTKNFSKDIANDVKKWFDTSNYSEADERPFPRGMNKKIIGLFNDELGGKIMIEFVALRPKMYSYLRDDGSECIVHLRFSLKLIKRNKKVCNKKKT